MKREVLLMEIVLLCGSLRKQSYNRKLLNTIKEHAPSHWTFTEIAIDRIPFYNADVEESRVPDEVTVLKEGLTRADGVIIVSPEYNNGMPAVVKNALDWAASPPQESPLPKKPIALAGASPQGAGTVQAQTQLRQTLIAIDAYVMSGPKLLVGQVHTRVEVEDEQITEEGTVKRIKKYVKAFDEWITTLSE